MKNRLNCSETKDRLERARKMPQGAPPASSAGTMTFFEDGVLVNAEILGLARSENHRDNVSCVAAIECGQQKGADPLWMKSYLR
jgi:hypothetical protein